MVAVNLEEVLDSKGYHINLHDNKITRMYMVNWGDRSFSKHEELK